MAAAYVPGTGATPGYTGNGLRAWKADASGRLYYLYDGADPVAELDANGTIQAVNTFGASGLVSRRTTATNRSIFYAFDERGNVAQRLDAGGSVLSTDLYDAFGARTSTAPPSDPWGFGAQWGYQTDAETGLVLCTNRYYDPQQGRFLTRDPLGYDGGVNLYSYTANDPVDNVDPDGYNVPSPGLHIRPPHKPTWVDILQSMAEDDPFPEFGPRPPTAPNRPTPPPARKPVIRSSPPADWPNTQDKIPGGPWEWHPNPTNARGGSFRGPVTKNIGGIKGRRPELTYAEGKYGKPGYWKCNRAGGVKDKYWPDGSPRPPDDQGHPTR